MIGVRWASATVSNALTSPMATAIQKTHPFRLI
jgi:hypothetical protein